MTGSYQSGRSLVTMLSRLAAGTGDVRARLAAALGRPELTVAYWLPDAERWVDPVGERSELDEAGPGVTVVSYRGERVAALTHAEDLDREGPVMHVIALVLENERLRLALHSRLAEQQALRRIATAVAGQHPPDEVLELVAEEVARHLGGDSAMTARYDGPSLFTVVAEWSAAGIGHFPKGRQIRLGGPTALARVQRTGAPARVDSYEGMPGVYPAELRALGVRATVAAPIVVDGALWGAVAVASASTPFPPRAEARLGAFAELVAQAVANVDARIKLHQSRTRIVEAADAARRKLERDLHDGAQQRLVSLALCWRCSLARRRPPPRSRWRPAPTNFRRPRRIARARPRHPSRGPQPSAVLRLPCRRSRLARRCLSNSMRSSTGGCRRRTHEAALYFVAAEALTNVAKYANATTAKVTFACRAVSRDRDHRRRRRRRLRVAAVASAASPTGLMHWAEPWRSKASPASAQQCALPCRPPRPNGDVRDACPRIHGCVMRK